MTKANVFILEDEFIVLKDIQASLKKLGYNIVGSAPSGEKALELLEEVTPDIVLMDIMLKGKMNGIETAQIVKDKYAIPVIYLTAYAEEATLNLAKVTEPYGYILKPFKEIDLHTSIEMALYKHKKDREIEQNRDMLYSLFMNKEKEGDDFIFIKSNNKLVKLEMNEIYFIEALKDYVVINTNDTRYTIHSTMKDIEVKLGTEDFIRVHRSFIVRLDKITSIDFPNLQLGNDRKLIPIGGSYREELTNRIKTL
jgi:DNA-binding LytR/AlgR family response regulator